MPSKGCSSRRSISAPRKLLSRERPWHASSPHWLPTPHAHLPPGGVQGWRACLHAQPGRPTCGAPTTSSATQLHFLTPRECDAPVVCLRRTLDSEYAELLRLVAPVTTLALFDGTMTDATALKV